MSSNAADQGVKKQFREDRILAKPKPGVAERTLAPLRARHGGKTLRRYPRFRNLEVIELEKGRDIGATIAALKESGLYEYVEPDYIRQTFVTPNDPLFTNQWSLHNTGQSGGTADADIDAPEAWDIQTNAADAIVAIVDTGIRLDHEDIAPNLWVNPGEIPGDGIDNDGNGYIDDVNGINAIGNNGNPSDPIIGHGTHVAGIIGARGDNGVGIAGVAWRVKLMPLRWLGPDGGSTSDEIECLNYAMANGAQIINASYGGALYSRAEYDAINTLRTNGIIVVAASGNSALDMDYTFLYPAAFDLDNIVTVNATTRSNTLVFFSDFGYLATDLGAPGYQIQSAFRTSTNAYQIMSGTSMAAPHVAGALALLRSRLPSEHYIGLIYRLLGNVDITPAMRGRCSSDGQLNLHKLLYESATSSPLNDNFTNRINITGERWTRFGRNTIAGKEPGEQNHAGNSGGGSIWWTWTAPYSGFVELSTAKSFETNGAPLDTLLAVYTGSSVGSLTEVGSNDNGTLTEDGTNSSRLILTASAGTTYQIAVDGRDGASGNIRLSLAYAPQNDALASAYRLNGLYIACDGWNLGATKENNEADHAGNVGGRSIWYSWRAPVSGDFVITTEGSSFDTLLGVYTGSSYPLTFITSNNNDTNGATMDDYGGRTSAVRFTASGGETYRIAVDGFDGQAGHLVLAGGYKTSATPIAQTLGVADAGLDRFNASNQIVGPWVPVIGTVYGYTYDIGPRNFHNWGLWQETNHTTAHAINDLGVAVGYAVGLGFYTGNTAAELHAIRWDAVNGMHRLDQRNEFSEAFCMDARGIAGGFYNPRSNSTNFACYWLSNNFYALPVPFTNALSSGVNACDRAGTMVGHADLTPGPKSVGLIWRNIPGDVSVLKLGQRLGESSHPLQINERGEIAGESSQRSVVWIENQPKLAGFLGFASEARGLNNLGQTVGLTKKLKYDAVRSIPVISQNGVDLNLDRLAPAGWTYNVANAIDDKGLIAMRALNATNFVVSIASPPPALTFQNPILADDHFTVTLNGPEGIWQIEATTDLTTTNWITAGTLTLTNGSGQFTDADASSHPNRFYRARSGSQLSANVAGYLVREVPAGQSIAANPLHCADNRIPALMPSAVDGTMVWKYDADVQAYREANMYIDGYGWTDIDMTLNPGEGVIVEAWSGFTNRWAGIVPQNLPKTDLLAGPQIVGSQTAVSGRVDTVLGFPIAHGDVVYTMNTSGEYTAYTYNNGNWVPNPPVVKLGEGFWAQRADPVTWRQNLSVW